MAEPQPVEPPSTPPAAFRDHPVEFVLRLFADVRAGEATTVLALTANVLLLLTAYYLLKVAREPLILMGGGAEVKAYAAAGQSMLLLLVAAAYGWLARHVGRLKLITCVSLFFAGNLVIFWALGQRGVPLGVPFYLWVGVFSLTVIAQFWSFAADLYTEEQGKRLFPIIGVGSSVGSVVGAWLAKKVIFIGPFGLMLTAATILVGCLGITWAIQARESRLDRDHATDGTRPHHDEPFGKESGFTLILRDRYLLAIGALALVINWVNTTGEYVLDRTLLASAHEQAATSGVTVIQFVGAFKADYFAWVNGLGVVLQLFAVSRIIKHLGVRKALFVMPIVSLGAYATMALVPVLTLIFAAKVAENSLDYSLQNTANQALWLVTARDAKYKAKQIIDTILVRLGDVLSAVVVWVGTRLAFQTVHFMIWNVALIVAWFGVLVVLGREHRRRTTADGTASPTAVTGVAHA